MSDVRCTTPDAEVLTKRIAESQALFEKLKISSPFFILAGPCVVESREHALFMSKELKKIAEKLNLTLVYKSSFDKANRTSVTSFRGPGIEEGLKILKEVKETTGLPIVTDIHESYQAELVADVVDILQIPAFLCRQTDLILAAAKTGRILNMKKGQFASPTVMVNAAQKARSTGNDRVMLCERGTMFGYEDLLVDPRNLVRMRKGGNIVVQDVTHSVQQPASNVTSSGGLRQFVPTIARMSVAVGVDGLFFEVHENPAKALSDGPNNWPLDEFEQLLAELIAISNVTNGRKNIYRSDADLQ
jgi:2-dehydro-3-deoxyphosphooctonate aldolase (KDO 8-P synthase)